MTTKPLDTYGWDTALVLRVSDVNRLLAPGARVGEGLRPQGERLGVRVP